METIIERYNAESELQWVERADGSQAIEGYAVRWYDGTPGTEYKLPNGRVERIERHAFDDVLKSNANVQLRWNHSRDFTLGDTTTGLILRSDQYGIRFSHPYDASDPDHVKVKTKIKKGLAKGSSFKASAQLRFADENGQHIQYVSRIINLEDVSVVDRPAYAGTAALVRYENEEEIERSYQDWLASEKQKAEDAALLEKLNNLIREK